MPLDAQTGTDAFKYFMTPDQRFSCFSNAVSLVSDLLPGEDVKSGMMYERWQTCNAYVQHVVSLRDYFVEEQTLSDEFSKGLWKFSDPLNRSQR